MKLHCLYLCMVAMAFSGCGEDGGRRSPGGNEGTQSMIEECEPVVNPQSVSEGGRQLGARHAIRETHFDSNRIGMLYQAPDNFNRTMQECEGEISLSGTTRRVWPNRALPIYDDSFYPEGELHVVELWSDSVYFDRQSKQFLPLPIYCSFKSSNWRTELASGQVVVIRGTCPGHSAGNNDIRVHDCEIVEAGEIPAGTAPSPEGLNFDTAIQQKNAFNEAVQRLRQAGVIGYQSGNFFLTLDKDSLSESGLIKQEIVEEFPALAGIYHISLPENISSDGLTQVVQLKSLREVEFRLPRGEVEAIDLQGLAASQIESIRFESGRHVNDNVLQSLANAKMLQELVIGSRANISNEGLAAIGKLKNLQVLSVAGTKVTDEGLKNLSELTKLRDLYIGGPELTGTGLSHLRAAKSLFRLELWAPKGTPETLSVVSTFPSLTSLRIANYSYSTFQATAGESKIGTGDFLMQLPDLQSLEFYYVDEIKPGLGASLKDAKNLFGISISGSTIADGTFSDLTLPAIQVANLVENEISDEEALRLLQSAQKLTLLNLESCPITDKFVLELPELTPELQYLGLRGTQVTKACRPALIKLDQLKAVTLNEAFSFDDAESFRKEHPKKPLLDF